MKYLAVITLIAATGYAQAQPFPESPEGKVVKLAPANCQWFKEGKGFGTVIIEYESEYNKQHYPEVSRGLVIANYIVGSPADAARLPFGAVVTKVNGSAVSKSEDIYNLITNNSLSEAEIELFTPENGFKTEKIRVATPAEYIQDCTFQYRYNSSK